MASTMSPTWSLLEPPNVAGCRFLAPLTLMTARSSGRYRPTRVACSGDAELASSTLNVVALPTTWAWVTVSPGEAVEPGPPVFAVLVQAATPVASAAIMAPVATRDRNPVRRRRGALPR